MTKPNAAIQILTIRTSRRTELQDITEKIELAVRESHCSSGVCHFFVPHTTAGILINEGYDPDVARDMEAAFDRLIPDSPAFRHAEGNSDSHIKTALVGTSETVWIENGRLSLGQWQRIFFAEYDGPRARQLRLKIVPDSAV